MNTRAITFLIALLTALTLLTAPAKLDGEIGTVTADTLNVRRLPDKTSEVQGKLKKGGRVNIAAQEGDYYFIIKGDVYGYVLAEYIRPASEDTLEKQHAGVYFYDAVKEEYVTVEKDFYWAVVKEGKRRFDTGIPDWALSRDGDGDWVPSNKVKNLTKRIGLRLFKKEGARVTILFGQYYPDAKDDAGKTYSGGIHEGIDYAGPAKDATFYSLTDGTVTVKQIGKNNSEYSYIGVKTGDKTIFYIHGAKYFVDVGDKVKAGQKLGEQGDMGAPGAFHVHLEVDSGDALDFKRSKNTVLENTEPYTFWQSAVK